ncbi:DUF7527 domain-containing protein [Haloarcula marina]|uniref:DUF7527 domain-containing protein n=1 Tax=Haloarcula marina TaxID=2961574 RepID=UPI0020B7ED66|nr:hypothetical protein [Halomicroarcula marina]
MSTRTVELVSEWDSAPFDGGFEGLRSLSDQDFSGVVVAGPARLFMLKGTVVGILDGDIDDFESGGTAREAPHEALPLLAVMQERSDEVRAKYYTQETAISEVDRTLADGNFTGFVELSENVLSGDYYLVYHQGRSMSVAWVGSSKRLVTDDDAFEQADDEVGIYEVKPAEISPVEIPEPPEDETAAESDADTVTGAEVAGTDADPPATDAAASTPDDSPADETAADDRRNDDAGGTAETTESGGPERGPGPAAGGPPGSKAAGASQGSRAGRAANSSERDEPADRTERQRSGRADERGESAGSTADSTTADASAADSPRQAESTQPPDRAQDEATRRESPQNGATTTGPEPVEDGAFADVESTTPTPKQAESPATRQPEPEPEQGQSTPSSPAESDSGSGSLSLETRAIPSLDPDQSTTTADQVPDDASTQSAGASTSRTHDRREEAESTQPTSPPQSTPDRSQQRADRETARRQGSEQRQGQGGRQQVTELQAELDGKAAEIDRLEGEVADLEATNEELRTERDRLESELETAQAEIRELEGRISDLQSQSDDAATGGTRLSPVEAIDGTNLFVRYHSKGEATLKAAHDGDADPAQVEENLRLEYHTQFDASDTVVEGTAFETYLQESIHYRFVEWLIRNLLYEIRDTGHAGAMQGLYDALPEVDRAELNGKVSVTYTEDGQEHRSQEQFDVVVRDRMGNPLIVANINDSRQAATDGQMTTIVRNAERVGNASDSLAAAFLVTSSFFEPEALETAKEATSSGLFSRDKRKSFVNLSRKDGYHLCLLEARNKEFHLAVPEL